MSNNKNNKGQNRLAKTTATIFGAALAGLAGAKAVTPADLQSDDTSGLTLNAREFGKVKPMPILKLNLNDPSNSRFVASHASHRSHASHSSHHSHRSGAMFA